MAITEQPEKENPTSGSRRGGLRTKIIAWSFVPTALVLLAVALVTFFAFQRVTEELVIERDREVTYVAANQLAAGLAEYEDRLAGIARNSDLYEADPATQADALDRLSNRLVIFDGGVVLLNAFGRIVAAEPHRPEIIGHDWSDRDYFQEIVRSQIIGAPPALLLSNVRPDGLNGANVIVMAYPITDGEDAFHGVLAGMFRVGPRAINTFYGDIIRLRTGESGSTYLVDSSGRVIYHSDTRRIGSDFSTQSVVQQVLGRESDAVRTNDFGGKDIVAGFAPVPGTPWGLVTEETWSTLAASYQDYRNFLLFLLVLGVVLPAIVVGFGVRRITKPIADLIDAAQEVARGNFGQTITARTGDEIEDLAGRFNLMSAQLQESYASLEQKVADRTKELATLNAIAEVVSRSLDLDEILSDALDETLALLDVEAGAILLIEPKGKYLVPHVTRGLSDEFLRSVPRLRLDEGIAGQAVSRRRPIALNVDDYAKGDFGGSVVPTVLQQGFYALASAPLVHTGTVLGVMNLATRRERAFPPGELEMLTAIGQQIGVAVENAQLYEQAQQELAERTRAEEELRQVSEERARRNRELVLLNRVIAATTSRLEPRAVLDAVCRELALAFDVPEVGAALLDDEEECLKVVAEYITRDRPSALGTKLPVEGNPSAEYVIEHKAPLAVADAQQDPRMAPVHHLMRERGTASLLILPLTVRDRAVGTIGLVAVDRREFSGEEVALAANAAAAASQALETARAEEELRESEERLTLAMEGANIGLWDRNLMVDESVVIKDWTETLGYEPGDLAPTYENWYALVHPDDKAKLEEAWTQFELGETAFYEVEHRVRAKSGDWVWVLLRGDVVQRDEQGAPLRIAGIHQDITARKEAEEALRRSRQRLSLHVQQTPLAYIEWDADLRVVEWNPSAERIFGYTEGEAKGRHAFGMIVSPEVQPQVTEVWQNLRNQAGGTRSTNENITKDGRKIVCEWYNTPLIDENGQVIGLASLVQDITERVEADEALREAKDAAETANQAKSIFLANMSHELRTPLNAILGFAQLMMRDPGITYEQRESLDIIGRSGEHLLGLINDILEMSKIEAGRLALQKESIDLYLMLDDLEEMFGLRAEAKDLLLILDRASDVPQFVRADEGKLKQVLMNLLGNAIKFTQEGGVTLRVGCSPLLATGDPEDEEACPRLRFEVQDTGAGIAPEEMPALFDPFVQTAAGQKSQEGTGLGLPISRRFVRLMGGDFVVKSEVGQGSIFTFDVPLELADPAEIPQAQPTRRVVGLEPGQPVYRLLVVEDQETNRRLLVNLLAKLGSPMMGFEVKEAVNGRQALEIWEQWAPHMIWMDLRMPVMDGYEATKRIRELEKKRAQDGSRGESTVIVALTASAFDDDRNYILAEGCHDFVRKPYREQEIVDVLTKHLGVRFMYEELAAGDEDTRRDDTTVFAQELAPERLARLPGEWLDQLHRATVQLDADAVLGLAEDVREQDTRLADALARLVRDFRFDVILASTESLEDEYA
jgi:PAS domain S-box-containing protein